MRSVICVMMLLVIIGCTDEKHKPMRSEIVSTVACSEAKYLHTPEPETTGECWEVKPGKYLIQETNSDGDKRIAFGDVLGWVAE